MLIANIIRNSFFILLCRKTREAFCSIEQWLERVYKESQIYRLIKAFWVTTKIIFRYSFLGKITEVTEEDNTKKILENSRLVKSLRYLCDHWKDRIDGYLKTSSLINYTIELKNGIITLPVKSVSIVIVVAILTDITFSILFKNSIHNETGLLGWIIKVALLLLGFAGLFCEVSLENPKKSSLFIGWIEHNSQSISEGE